MIEPVKYLLENPEDTPDIPYAVKEYLQGRFNYAYLEASGHLARLRSSGCSEAHILGFIQGLHYASNVIDEVELRKEQLEEEG